MSGPQVSAAVSRHAIRAGRGGEPSTGVTSPRPFGPGPGGVGGARARCEDGAVSEQSARYQRSPGGLVAALGVLVVLIIGWVVFRAVFVPNPATPQRTVDYADAVGPARQAARFDLVAPRSLPAGWRATSVRFTTGGRQHWHLGVLTDRGRYVGLEQGRQSVPDPGRGVRRPRRVARRPGAGARAAVGDVHRQRGRPGPGPARRPDHDAGRRPRRRPVGAGGLHGAAALRRATAALRSSDPSASSPRDRGVEPLLGAVEPAPGRPGRASRPAPRARASPRGRVPPDSSRRTTSTSSSRASS